MGGLGLNKRLKLLIIAIACIVTICGIFIIRNSFISPYEFLLKESIKGNKNTRPTEKIYEVNSDDGKYFIFYINESGSLACAVIKKGYFSHKLLRTSSEILITNGKKPFDAIYSSYNKGKSWISWGILRDKSIHQVLVNGRNAVIIKVYDTLIFYTFGDSNDLDLSVGPSYQYLDKKGQVIYK